MAAKGARVSKTAVATSVSREKIRDEAIRLFGERGYPVIGMRHLSDAVGILPGSLYAHIKGKESLLLEIVETGILNYTAAIAPIVDNDEPADARLRDALRAHMRVLAETLEQTRVTFHQWQYLGAENRIRAVAVRQEYEDLFTRLINDGIAAGTFRDLKHRRVAVLSIIGILGSATEWFVPSGKSTPDEIADAIADNILGGLLKP